MNSATWLIFKRELGGYTRTISGYIIVALALFIDGILFNALALSAGEQRSGAVLAQFFFLTSGITMIAAVFLSMRLLAEEKQTGTLVLLTSSPVRDWEIVLGKFFAAWAFMGIMMVLTVFMPALIMVNGKISVGQVVVGYLGLMLLGGAALALGTLGSALARSQVLAAIISAVLVVGLILMWMVARVTEHPLNQVFEHLALYHKHFTTFQVGTLHLRDVVYYLALIYFALFCATRVLEARRWR
jgi:ABC-2 type transport system permease protein